MRNILTYFPIFLVLTLGSVLVGLALFTFIYAKGFSYASNKPEVCANCHIMEDHYRAWLKSSHRNVAVCNDCHTPQHPVGKWLVKAHNGFWHSYAFTTMDFVEPLRATKRNQKIAQERCLSCHQDIFYQPQDYHQLPMGACVQCHRGVGHAY